MDDLKLEGDEVAEEAEEVKEEEVSESDTPSDDIEEAGTEAA